MVARIRKATAPGRDNQLLARIEHTAKQPGLIGWTVNRDGLEAIRTEVDPKGKLFGCPVFCVVPQKERVRAWWWHAKDLEEYLARFRLKV